MFVRLDNRPRAPVALTLDGSAVTAREGDTLLTAILLNRPSVRESEFGDGPRAGFCLMGACQDCWVWLGRSRRVRACTTLVAPGMTVHTAAPPIAPAPSQDHAG